MTGARIALNVAAALALAVACTQESQNRLGRAIQNWVADPGEKKLYFEVSDYSTSYVFYENPR